MGWLTAFKDNHGGDRLIPTIKMLSRSMVVSVRLPSVQSGWQRLVGYKSARLSICYTPIGMGVKHFRDSFGPGAIDKNQFETFCRRIADQSLRTAGIRFAGSGQIADRPRTGPNDPAAVAGGRWRSRRRTTIFIDQRGRNSGRRQLDGTEPGTWKPGMR